MPNIQSAKKRMRQNEKRRIRNKNLKSRVKSSMQSVVVAVESKDAKKAQTALQDAASVIGKAIKKSLLHRNNAARKVSKLARKVNSLR